MVSARAQFLGAGHYQPIAELLVNLLHDSHLNRERIAALAAMNVPALREQHRKVFGKEPVSTHRQFLFRKIAWRLQADEEGWQPDAVRQLARGIARNSPLRNRVITNASKHRAGLPPEQTAVATIEPDHDPRLLMPGGVIVKQHKGRTHVVQVLDDGRFAYDDRRYTSLSAITQGDHGYQVEWPAVLRTNRGPDGEEEWPPLTETSRFTRATRGAVLVFTVSALVTVQLPGQTQEGGAVSKRMLYRHFLAHVALLDADTKPISTLDSRRPIDLYPSRVGLSAAKFSLVRAIARHLDAAIRAKDEQAKEVIRRFRLSIANQQTSGGQLPPPPAGAWRSATAARSIDSKLPGSARSPAWSNRGGAS